ncbi:hypothetical protein B0H17DRAFT_925883 [Mycena rosella]|uniref:Uncharacterized protein n=1 Tax=Mycena rosella TaxID=1033263 RepID=A0AAD7DV48_MYCRO|nr:hypothetical protein B0H17DRAFT_925883 [Mycena rosella]
MSALAYPFWRFTAFRPLHRLLLQGPPRHSSGIPPTSHPVDRIRQANFDLLLESLEVGGNPTRVWANYTNLLTFLGYERLPLKIHQQVLRKCTPSSRLLRASATRRLFVGNVPRTPHVYEGRFQAVVRNIRISGGQPTLDDYNFILEQFAAVGHHFGVMQVYSEMLSVGLVPRTKTFGLCLQAIAHRLTLPVTPTEKARRLAVTRRMVSDLVNAMKSFNIPFTSVNLDLTMRILKETTDMESFETLMKWGYGIDLANPDCPPLEHLASSSATADTQPPVKGPPPQPFSTAALNMTLDTLGRLKNIPRLVQAFEVLTTPLPRRATSSYDEDDDDDFGEPTSASTFMPPSAPPNTTTYNILLRHLSQAGHAVFARHYLIQAMELDRQVMLELKHNLGKMPLQEVPAPHFAINRGTLLSVFGESNRDKNVGLMRWLHSKFTRILRKKRGELKFFADIRDSRRRKKKWPYENPSTEARPALLSSPMKSAIRPAPLPREQVVATTIMQRWRAPKNVGAVFDLDLEDEGTPTPTPSKTFDLDLHIRVLERDISEIEVLYAYVQKILGRTIQSVKERLGRRVFRGKDIYLLTEGERRRVSRERWEEIARFKTPQSGKRQAQRIVLPWSDAVNRRRERPAHLASPQPDVPIQNETP